MLVKILQIIDLTNSNATPKAANLQARSGVEHLIFATPGTSDLQMDTYSYAMEGWINF